MNLPCVGNSKLRTLRWYDKSVKKCKSHNHFASNNCGTGLFLSVMKISISSFKAENLLRTLVASLPGDQISYQIMSPEKEIVSAKFFQENILIASFKSEFTLRRCLLLK